jgi:hypothetical protein
MSCCAMRLWGDYAVGMVKDCNWLQHYENIIDSYHLLVLHLERGGDRAASITPAARGIDRSSSL